MRIKIVHGSSIRTRGESILYCIEPLTVELHTMNGPTLQIPMAFLYSVEPCWWGFMFERGV